MKYARNPITHRTRVVLAGLLVTVGAGAMAQTAPAASTPAPTAVSQPAGPSSDRWGHHDPVKIQAVVAKRQADMKAKLQITAAQESAWTSFTAAMQPARTGSRLTPTQRAEFDKLPTPERVDKMRALRTQHTADMSAAADKRGEATKIFYAALTPEQQKVFDAEHKKHGPEGNRNGPGQTGAAGGARR